MWVFKVNIKNYRNYLSPLCYWRRFLNLVNQYILHFFDIYNAPINKKEFEYPPIFILGAPRSGSTLLYQVVTDAFHISYISNRHCQFYGSPALTEKVLHPLKHKKESTYTSEYGETNGWPAPSECGAWWYRFFQHNPAYVTLEDIDDIKMSHFRRSILAFTEEAGEPLIFKNLYASLRIQGIVKYIPEALFVIVHRNELDNGHSILKGRYETFGNYDNWWSVPPKNIEKIKKLESYEQVVEQIRGIHKVIDIDLKLMAVPKEQIYHIKYEDFCDNVHIELSKLQEFFNKNNCRIKKRDSAIPEVFKRKKEIRIDNEVYEKMFEYVSKKVESVE